MIEGLEGRRAIVCGSTRGIGRACAVEFARLGAEVTLVARDAAALDAVTAELPAGGELQHRHIVADFDDWAALRECVQASIDEHGPAHVLLNNCGGPAAGPGFQAEPQAYADSFAKHLLANQALAQAVVPGMRDAGYGRIINIISTSVVMPIMGLGVSNAVRGAVGNWGRTLAAELGPFGITVNNILPGFTATKRLASIIAEKAKKLGCPVDELEDRMRQSIPLRRFADAAEIAAVAGFLATPAAAYVNGVNLPVDGGRLAAI